MKSFLLITKLVLKNLNLFVQFHFIISFLMYKLPNTNAVKIEFFIWSKKKFRQNINDKFKKKIEEKFLTANLPLFLVIIAYNAKKNDKT